MYSVGLLGMGAVFLLVRAFAAQLDTKTPVRISVVAFLLNVVLNLLLIRTPLQHAGLALASSISFTVHAVILYVLLNRRADAAGASVRPADIAIPALKVAVSGAVLLLVAWAVDGWMLSDWLGTRFADSLLARRLLRMLAVSVTGGAAYLVSAAVLGLAEVRQLLPRLTRR
jgi:putative peptidoglycan lipid II flippase